MGAHLMLILIMKTKLQQINAVFFHLISLINYDKTFNIDIQMKK